MSLNKTKGVWLGVALLMSSGLSVQAAYPEKPITIVVSAAPGGSPDILARLIGKHLADKLKQPVHIENKPGGAGNIATSYVARSKPDGYTLYVATDSLAINQTLFKERGYDALSSFAPIIQAIEAPQIFAPL